MATVSRRDRLTDLAALVLILAGIALYLDGTARLRAISAYSYQHPGPRGQSALTAADQGTGPLDILDSVLASISGQTSPENQQELFRLIQYRDLPSPNGQYGFKVYIRNDLLPLFNSIRYGSE